MPSKNMTKDKATCFVIMGFGKKTDFQTGRTLDLDKVYKNMIKPAVETAGLKCIRADEIIHSGFIDVPMYDQLLNADIVVADLSTSNMNVLYELGVRHALRPFATIVIAEDGNRWSPFDINHVPVFYYHHLGEDLGFEETTRFREVLTKELKRILSKKIPEYDSPVYTFLQGLKPPEIDENDAQINETTDKNISDVQIDQSNKPRSLLVEQSKQAINDNNFIKAKELIQEARIIDKSDPYLIRLHALTTYKASQPDPVSALYEARNILRNLIPDDSSDTLDRETLELMGDIEFGLYELGKGANHLITARGLYNRAFAIKEDWQNGITLAYLITEQIVFFNDEEEKTIDRGLANRIRRQVVELGKQRLAAKSELRKLVKQHPEFAKDEYQDEQFRIWCAIAESYYGLGNIEAYLDARDRATQYEKNEGKFEQLDKHIARMATITNKGKQFKNAEASNLPSIPVVQPALPINSNNTSLKETGNVGTNKVKRDVIFFCYSHEDDEWLEEIKKMLAPVFKNKQISLWDDKKIKTGDKWRDEINEALSRANGAVLLVSSDFLASDFITDHELPYILEHAGPEGVKLIWVAVDDCLYEGTELEKYQCVNDPKNPLTNIEKTKLQSELAKICRKIRDTIFPTVEL